MTKEEKANELEREAKRLRLESFDEQRRIQREKERSFEEKTKIDLGVSDDYAVLTIDSLGVQFYFGYEMTACPKHGKKDCRNDEDCDLSEWAFVVTKKDKELLRLPQSKISPKEGEEPMYYLLMGIAHYLNSKDSKYA